MIGWLEYIAWAAALTSNLAGPLCWQGQVVKAALDPGQSMVV